MEEQHKNDRPHESTPAAPEASRIGMTWTRLTTGVAGLAALAWFLIRVIPKPSRASYPCQRAAFPVASAFVIWLAGSLAGLFGAGRLRRRVQRYRWLAGAVGGLAVVAMAVWTLGIWSDSGLSADRQPINWHWQPDSVNAPLGEARGIFPGRVVWARDPAATKWGGQWKAKEGQWWTDESTDKKKVEAMVSATLLKLTGAASDEAAWQAIFNFYNKKRGVDRGYKAGEIVAVKINLNNSDEGKTNNQTDVAPQMVLAMVRQLVNQAHVAQRDIVVYDVRRNIYPAMLTEIWSEFKDVRFLQQDAPKAKQPKNPGYGDYHGLENAKWVEGVSYSSGNYRDAKLIPQQIMDATYLVNLALLKCHSYPYNTMEDGDNGQTAVSMTGKNHFGSIKGTPELHGIINTAQQGVKNAYSPMVDLAASPNLGAKTILFMLDGLYAGRKWRTYPLHFPNAPFNNRVEPYENTDWPASVLASLDGVALDSVGLDILNSQTKNNGDPKNNNEPRILVRENADDYLHEMALAGNNPPSKTVYVQGGKPVTSMGVHEHWDSDATRRYSRNLDPKGGKGIELLYLPLGQAAAAASDGPAVKTVATAAR